MNTTNIYTHIAHGFYGVSRDHVWLKTIVGARFEGGAGMESGLGTAACRMVEKYHNHRHQCPIVRKYDIDGRRAKQHKITLRKKFYLYLEKW